MLTIDSLERKDPRGRDSQIFRFRFVPKLVTSTVPNVSISVTFFQDLTTASNRPRIIRIVQMYNVIPRNAEVFDVNENDDVGRLKGMLEAGQAPIYDIDNHMGESLLIVRKFTFYSGYNLCRLSRLCASLLSLILQRNCMHSERTIAQPYIQASSAHIEAFLGVRSAAFSSASTRSLKAPAWPTFSDFLL